MKNNVKILAGAGLLCILTQLSCGQQSRRLSNPPGYDLSKPEKFNMPEELLEVSGIAFHNGDPALIYAEQDEEGSVFSLKFGDKAAKATIFGKQGDYEDISILRNRVYVLRSDGSLYSFSLTELRKPEAAGVVEFEKILPKAEYEGLFGDEKTGKLYALVKTGGGKKNAEGVSSGYILQTNADKLKVIGDFNIDTKEIAQMAGKKKLGFKPSALAQHPRTGEWFIVSSVNKALVVCASNWQVKAVYPLGDAFLQPEGIAFDKAGNLYISNEGDQISPGDVLKFSVLKK